MITRREFMKRTAAGAALAALAPDRVHGAARPNIIFVLADDVGYGDLGCYGATHVKTPHLDRIAREGVRFTDAHATASVCTPSRYAFLTGQYAFRNPDGDHILSGVAPCAIKPGVPTAASVLQSAEYATGLVGKWHLGLGTHEAPVDYNSEMAPGPRDVGFDYAFYFPATNDRVPCVYIEDRRVVGLDPADPIRVSYAEQVGDEPTGLDHPEMLTIKADKSHSQTIVNGISRIGFMAGGKAARWVDEDMADTLTGKAVAFIERQKAGPFFLYFAPADIHEPMAPHARFKGTSGCGSRGDAIHELDWSVGQLLGALDRLGLAENTLVVFSSDNGGALKDTYDDGTNALHGRQAPNGILRGQKGGMHEGGHREPFLARWPGRISPARTSDELIGLVDMLATFAAAAECPVPDDGGPDSFNALPALLDPPHPQDAPRPPVRDHLVIANGKRCALRQGPWKFIPNDGKRVELYHLADDPGESKNLAKKQPEKVAELAALLKRAQEQNATRK